MMSAGAMPGFPFYQQQPVGGFPRRWPAQLTGLPSGFSSHSGPLQPAMFPGSQDALSWDPMWRPVMPQAGTMPMLQARPAPQVSNTARNGTMRQEMTELGHYCVAAMRTAF